MDPSYVCCVGFVGVVTHVDNPRAAMEEKISRSARVYMMGSSRYTVDRIALSATSTKPRRLVLDSGRTAVQQDVRSSAERYVGLFQRTPCGDGG